MIPSGPSAFGRLSYFWEEEILKPPIYAGLPCNARAAWRVRWAHQGRDGISACSGGRPEIDGYGVDQVQSKADQGSPSQRMPNVLVSPGSRTGKVSPVQSNGVCP